MGKDELAIIISIAGFMAQLIVIIYRGGILTSKINQNSLEVQKNEKKIEKVEDRVHSQEVENGKLHDKVHNQDAILNKLSENMEMLRADYHRTALSISDMRGYLSRIEDLIRNDNGKN